MGAGTGILSPAPARGSCCGAFAVFSISTSTSGSVFSGVFSDLITGWEGSDGLVIMVLVNLKLLKLRLYLAKGVFVDDEVYGCFMHKVGRRPDVAEAEPRQGSAQSNLTVLKKAWLFLRSVCYVGLGYLRIARHPQLKDSWHSRLNSLITRLMS